MPAPRKKTVVRKKKAIATRQTTEVANLQERLRAMTQQQSETVDPSQSNRISIHNESQFKLPDGSIVNAPMTVVVVSFMARNVYYSRAYKKDVVSPADCAAQGFHKNDDLVPYPKDELIDQQDTKCGSCWANEFYSHPTSDAKACQNRKLVAVLGVNIGEDEQAIGLTKEMLRFDLSPTGTGKFDTFVDKLVKRYDKPTPCFAVDADIIPAGGTSHTIIFKDEQLLSQELILEAVNRVEEARAMLDIKPLLQSRDSESQPAKRPGKKKVTARRRS